MQGKEKGRNVRDRLIKVVLQQPSPPLLHPTSWPIVKLNTQINVLILINSNRISTMFFNWLWQKKRKAGWRKISIRQERILCVQHQIGKGP